MKKNFLIYLMSSLMIFTSCDTILDVEPLEFDVKVEKTTYRVGENVNFKIEGEPRYINFFSGEVGNDYDYLTTTRYVKNSIFSFYFTLQYQYPTAENQVEVYLLKDFTGDRSNYNDIHNLSPDKKINITSRYPLVTARNGETGITNKPNLMDIVQPGDKFNIAIRYKRDATTGGATIWFSNPRFFYSNGVNSSETALSLKDDFLQYAAVHPNKIPWRSQNRAYANEFPQYYTYSSSQTIIMWNNGNATAVANANAQYNPATPYALNTPLDEYWVSTQWTVEDGFDIKDWARSIKSYTDPKLTSYNYIFNEPGTYKVVFEAVNASAKETKKTTKEIFITVTEN